MGTSREPISVKLFAALLCNHESLFPSVEGKLKAYSAPSILQAVKTEWINGC
jgi:hypothetical protein